MGWRCRELEARAAGLKGNSQGTPAPARRRGGFVPLMSSGKLSDRANTGAGRHKPPVSCRLPQFAEGKAAWPCWVLSLRGTFFRLHADPNQSADQADPSLLHPSQTEQPLEKSLSEKGVIRHDLFCFASVRSPACLAALRIAVRGFNHAGMPAWCSPPVW